MQGTSALGAKRQIFGSFDAETLARSLAAPGLAWCWLDGEAPAAGEAAVSYFGITEHVFESARGGEREFLARLSHESPAASHAAPHAGREAELPAAAPTGFQSGWVAALSYEFGVALMGITPAPDDAPPAFALRLDAVLALTGNALELRAVNEEALAAWLREYGALLNQARNVPVPRTVDSAQPSPQAQRAQQTRPAQHTRHPRPAPAPIAPSIPSIPSIPPTPSIPSIPPTPSVWRRSGAQYEAQVAACQRAIAAGDAYVICLTDTATSYGTFDPISIYAQLRLSGTATRGAVICLGDRALVSASPERFLSVHGREVSTHPIKGTRPRGSDETSDRALAAELERDPKEQAENLMIVDLMRNDLNRVCDAGSVGVPAFLKVEQHPHVHQLVSTIVGRLSAGRGAVDALEACFPGGSMTGAPKRRVVELLGALEAGPRGLYSGCFGWIDNRGDAELAMTIRGVELRGLSERSQVALVGAGGGVTADSDPERERAEKDLKAASILAALRTGPA